MTKVATMNISFISKFDIIRLLRYFNIEDKKLSLDISENKDFFSAYRPNTDQFWSFSWKGLYYRPKLFLHTTEKADAINRYG